MPEAAPFVPPLEAGREANVARFMEAHGLAGLPELHRRSIAEPDWFYRSIGEAIDARWLEPYERVLDSSAGPQWPSWFPGGRMNAAINAVDKFRGSPAEDATAILALDESGGERRLSYRALAEQVDALAAALAAIGVERGDRVALFLPPVAEVAISLYACARIGAIAVPLFSGFSADAIVARLAQCTPKVVIAATSTVRRGRRVELADVMAAALASVPSATHVIVLNREPEPPAFGSLERLDFRELVASPPDHPLPPAPMEADAPWLIMYTSGSTGKPKGTVWTHSGATFKPAIDLLLCFDMKAGDRLFWPADPGWGIGPWMFLGTSVLGGTLVLYEGALDHPYVSRLCRLVDEHAVSILGLLPTIVRTLMSAGGGPPSSARLGALRILGSAGEAHSPESWRWFQETFGRGRLPLINYTGGTEVSGAILSTFPILPSLPCSFAGPVPGMAASVTAADGSPVRGEPGALVLRAPSLGMTRSLWDDDERYLETYWARWPGLWDHGDMAIEHDDAWYLLGRSDDALKVAGKLLNPAEIENVISADPRVAEAAVIGVPHAIKGEVPVAFVRLHDRGDASDETREQLRASVAQALGKPLSPSGVFVVGDLPRSRSAKVLRRVLRAQALREPLGDVSTLENPEVLAEVPFLGAANGPDDRAHGS